mmetsp:Transcript_33391/g.117023  ORF Transcript_33391/g.117023 Transcript_33391/m.117023 type:complete len:852 (+) Transcript_33391:326-2881(+)
MRRRWAGGRRGLRNVALSVDLTTLCFSRLGSRRRTFPLSHISLVSRVAAPPNAAVHATRVRFRLRVEDESGLGPRFRLVELQLYPDEAGHLWVRGLGKLIAHARRERRYGLSKGATASPLRAATSPLRAAESPARARGTKAGDAVEYTALAALAADAALADLGAAVCAAVCATAVLGPAAAVHDAAAHDVASCCDGAFAVANVGAVCGKNGGSDAFEGAPAAREAADAPLETVPAAIVPQGAVPLDAPPLDVEASVDIEASVDFVASVGRHASVYSRVSLDEDSVDTLFELSLATEPSLAAASALARRRLRARLEAAHRRASLTHAVAALARGLQRPHAAGGASGDACDGDGAASYDCAASGDGAVSDDYRDEASLETHLAFELSLATEPSLAAASAVAARRRLRGRLENAHRRASLTHAIAQLAKAARPYAGGGDASDDGASYDSATSYDSVASESDDDASDEERDDGDDDDTHSGTASSGGSVETASGSELGSEDSSEDSASHCQQVESDADSPPAARALVAKAFATADAPVCVCVCHNLPNADPRPSDAARARATAYARIPGAVEPAGRGAAEKLRQGPEDSNDALQNDASPPRRAAAHPAAARRGAALRRKRGPEDGPPQPVLPPRLDLPPKGPPPAPARAPSEDVALLGRGGERAAAALAVRRLREDFLSTAAARTARRVNSDEICPLRAAARKMTMVTRVNSDGRGATLPAGAAPRRTDACGAAAGRGAAGRADARRGPFGEDCDAHCEKGPDSAEPTDSDDDSFEAAVDFGAAAGGRGQQPSSPPARVRDAVPRFAGGRSGGGKLRGATSDEKRGLCRPGPLPDQQGPISLGVLLWRFCGPMPR